MRERALHTTQPKQPHHFRCGSEPWATVDSSRNFLPVDDSRCLSFSHVGLERRSDDVAARPSVLRQSITTGNQAMTLWNLSLELGNTHVARNPLPAPLQTSRAHPTGRIGAPEDDQDITISTWRGSFVGCGRKLWCVLVGAPQPA